MKKALILILDCIIACAIFCSALFGVQSFTAQAEETTPTFEGSTLNTYSGIKFLADIELKTDDDSVYTLTFNVYHLGNPSEGFFLYFDILNTSLNNANCFSDTVTTYSGKTYGRVYPYNVISETGETSTGANYFVFPVTVKLSASDIFEKVKIRVINTSALVYADSPTTSLYEKWATIDDLQAYGYGANASATISAYLRSEQAGFRDKVKAIKNNFVIINELGTTAEVGENLSGQEGLAQVEVKLQNKVLRFTKEKTAKLFCDNTLYGTKSYLTTVDGYFYGVWYENAYGSFMTDDEIAVADLPLTDDYTDSLEQSNSELRAELAELYERIAELEDKLATAEAKILELNNTISEKQREINNKQAEIDRLNGIITSLTQERNEYKVDAEELQQMVDGYKANVAELTGERDKLLNDVATLEAEKEALEEGLHGDNAELIDLYQKEKQKADNLQRENETLKKQNDELKKELEASKNKTGTVKVGCNADASESVSWIIPLIIFIILPQLVIMRFFKKETNKNDENNV